MENSAQHSGMDSLNGTSLFSSVLFVTVAARLQWGPFVSFLGWGHRRWVCREPVASRWW
jgi:hypothetical protein